MKTADLKFLYVTPGCFDKGGISRYNRYQIKSLIELFGQNNVRVLSLYGPTDDNLEDEFKVHWHGMRNDVGSKMGLIYNAFLQMLIWKPDYVFIGHVNFSGFIWMLARITNVKTVLNIYGLEVWGHMSNDARKGLKNVDYVIADCHFTANYVETNGLRSAGSTTVIWDCVDMERFRFRSDQKMLLERKYGLPDRENHFIILSLGRLSIDAAYKGYERLLIVFSKLINKYPNVRLIFAGKGDLIPRLQEQALGLGLKQYVFFTGSIPEEEMAGLYSHAHVFSLVSHRDILSGEGIPLTPLEAMACCVPIMVGNQDGSQEAVVGNRNGIVVDPFDIESQARFIESLIMDKAKRDHMAQESGKIARENFSYEGFKMKLSQFVEKIDG